MDMVYINKNVAGHRLPKSHIHAQMKKNPILRLPIEMLEAIFIHCARICCSEFSGSRTAPSWVNVSYVCHDWRNVALNCSRLWGYLSVVSPRWTEELLARSKQAPLKLFVYPDPQDNASLAQGFLKQAMKHVERIQELELDDLFDGSEDILFPELSSCTPLLENLTISANTISSYWSSMLFGGDTPSLRTLGLKRCPVPWNLFNLSSLTTLSLDDIPSDFQPSMADFLAMLSRMPNLTHLYLHYAIDSATDFVTSATFHMFQKINLLHLSFVLIIAPPSTVFAFLSCINIPSATHLMLQCGYSCDLSPDDYTLLSSILQQRIAGFENQALSCPRIRSLAITLGDGDTQSPILIASVSERAPFTKFIIINNKLHMSHRVLDDPLHIELNLDPPTVDNGVLCNILSSMAPLINIQSVNITNPPFSSAIWRKLLEHLPSLRHLKLSYGYMPDIAPVLSVTPYCNGTEKRGTHAGQHLDSVLAPALVELELDNISLSMTRRRGRHCKMDSDPPAGNVESLYAALRSRREHPGQLTMQTCVLTWEHGRQSKFFKSIERWEGGRVHGVFGNHSLIKILLVETN
ncbi:hypothetical protein EV363DRAFT_1280937 [Boletus edulis]|nr:hypothetical protein EV363DRAFT_1280937 [Boletus edulis]